MAFSHHNNAVFPIFSHVECPVFGIKKGGIGIIQLSLPYIFCIMMLKKNEAVRVLMLKKKILLHFITIGKLYGYIRTKRYIE